jgi:predicted DNA-binding ribbon-helix-helix protein
MTADRLVKRSLTIAGHSTSLRLEPIFWDALEAAAREEGSALSGLVAKIDAERIESPGPVNLASAIRVWLFQRATAGG